MNDRHKVYGEAYTTSRVQIEVDYREHGEVQLTFRHDTGYSLDTGRPLFRLDFGAELADRLIAALVPVLASKSANWEHVYVKAPNPNYRDEA